VNRLVVIVLVVALLGGLFVFGLLRGSPDRDIPSALIGKSAPDFTLPLYERYQPDYGEALSLAALQGTPLVVNFWASWCGPCYEEAPVLQATWEAYRERGVLFVGIQTRASRTAWTTTAASASTGRSTVCRRRTSSTRTDA